MFTAGSSTIVVHSDRLYTLKHWLDKQPIFLVTHTCHLSHAYFRQGWPLSQFICFWGMVGGGVGTQLWWCSLHLRPSTYVSQHPLLPVFIWLGFGVQKIIFVSVPNASACNLQRDRKLRVFGYGKGREPFKLAAHLLVKGSLLVLELGIIVPLTGDYHALGWKRVARGVEHFLTLCLGSHGPFSYASITGRLHDLGSFPVLLWRLFIFSPSPFLKAFLDPLPLITAS